MSECCLPNLGCLNIPIISTNVDGPPGQNGAAGRGILDESYEPFNGELTLTFTDNTTYTTGDLRGAQGDIGLQGVNGVSRLYSRLMDFYESTLINQWVQQHDYTVPANTLLNVGDSLVINLRSMKLLNIGGIFDCQRRIMWENQSCTLLVGTTEPYMISAEATRLQYNTTVEIIKSDVNEAICRVVSDVDLYIDNVLNSDKITYQVNLTGLNFGIDNVISSGLKQVAANQIYFKSITIDKITAV